jgi:hypothetical protein
MTLTIRRWAAPASLALAVLAGPALAAHTATPCPTIAPSGIVAPATVPLQATRDLYSARARRMVAAYLRLRMLELREDDLARVRQVIQGKLGVDALFSPPPGQASNGTAGR